LESEAGRRLIAEGEEAGMSDFYQTGVIATLHRLGEDGRANLEQQLERYTEVQPLALVLPALWTEFEKPALEGILQELSRVRYVQQFVLGLDRASEEQFRQAQQRFSVLPGDVKVIWNDGPRVKALFQTLEENGLNPGPVGKGRTCWMAYGYVLASRKADVIALHDCDIVNYDRHMLARLVYPVVNPILNSARRSTRE
jgi:glucosyl-3-phosphoglycerate synthase